MRFLITGGAGFIGSHFVEHVMEKYPDANVTVIDKLTYAGSKDNLAAVWDDIEFVNADINEWDTVSALMGDAEVVVNFAAESHVDRSIESGNPFLHSNVNGAYTLMDAARQHDIKKFIQISTDEVYGSIEEGKAKEGDPLDPSSPYSASKAAADMFANAFHTTYGLPIMIARPTNNFGPRQYPEKLIPKFIQLARTGEKLPLYGDGSNVRDWLYVKDNCNAIRTIIEKGAIGDIYNIGADNFKTNLEVTQHILNLLDKKKELISFVEDRPGHDERYAVDNSKIQELGWESKIRLKTGIEQIIRGREQ